MGVEILGSDHGKGQTIEIMPNIEEDKAQKMLSNDLQSDSVSVSEEVIKSGFPDVPNIGNSLKIQDGEKETVSDNHVPKDVTDEWPAPKEIHSFYLVKFRLYEDPQLKLKTDQADKDLQKKNQARYQITEALRAKRSQRAEVIEKLKPLTSQEKAYRKTLGDKRKEMEPLQAALGKFRTANITSREKGQGLCSSEEELNKRIQALHFRIQHDSNTLMEEKQMLKEIKQLEGTREKVIAHEALQAKIQDSLGEKEVIQDHVRLLGLDLDTMRKEQQQAWQKIKPLEEELRAIEEEINTLQEQLSVASQKRDKAFEVLQQLRKDRDAMNTSYFQYRSVLNIAKELASKKDKTGLEEVLQNEVEKFMSLWKSSKEFREEYKKKTLSSLSNRQLSNDGRMRNPDEEPPVLTEMVNLDSSIGKESSKKEIVHPKVQENASGQVSTDYERPLKERIPGSTKGTKTTQSTNTFDNRKTQDIDAIHKISPKHEPGSSSADDVSLEEISASKDETEAVAAQLKEKRREEEIAKAKLAMERKKRHSEKAQANAAARAQKEAEKKLKKREKRARKKAATALTATSEGEQSTEVDTRSAIAELENETTETPVQQKEDDIKEKPKLRRRDVVTRKRTKSTFPKGAWKKKESFPNFVWIGFAFFLVFVIMFVSYYWFL